MKIDFHTHTWPDRVAAVAVPSLKARSNSDGFTDGTNAGLSQSMKEAGVDLSIVLPVITNPASNSKINQNAAKVNETTEETGIFSFGGIHPEASNLKELVHECKELGLKGLKLHPDYVGIPFNDIRIKNIISYAEEEGLVVVTHAGMDIGLYPPIQCTIDMIIEVMKEVAPSRLILAHMGGWMNWEEVNERLPEYPVYLDTAFSIGQIPWIKEEGHKPYHMMVNGTFEKMVHTFGADRICFATDSPWADQKEYVELIQNMQLTDAEKEQIFSGTAKKLLAL